MLAHGVAGLNVHFRPIADMRQAWSDRMAGVSGSLLKPLAGLLGGHIMNFGIFAAITTLPFALAAPSSFVAATSARDIAAALPGASDVLKGTAEDRTKLLSLTEEWVRTWNEKDVDRMQQLQADDLLYGVFGSFADGPALLKQLRNTNFWGVTYSLRTVDPQVRILSSDTALVLFKLVGTSVGPKGSQPYRSLFTLVYQRRSGDWKIVHVHDSDSGEIG